MTIYKPTLHICTCGTIPVAYGQLIFRYYKPLVFHFLHFCWYLVKREGWISCSSACILSIYCIHVFRCDFQN